MQEKVWGRPQHVGRQPKKVWFWTHLMWGWPPKVWLPPPPFGQVNVKISWQVFCVFSPQVFFVRCAPPSTCPCQWVSQCTAVGDSFRFGDSYRISELCELVLDFPLKTLNVVVLLENLKSLHLCCKNLDSCKVNFLGISCLKQATGCPKIWYLGFPVPVGKEHFIQMATG